VCRAAADGDPAIRQFGSPDEAHYRARVFGSIGAVRIQVMREGREMWAAVAKPGEDGAISGVLPLAALPPGAYVLEISAVRDKTIRADQFIDFKVR
jgi:hypothetical protein